MNAPSGPCVSPSRAIKACAITDGHHLEASQLATSVIVRSSAAGHGETVARNRGADLRVFEDSDEALKWLIGSVPKPPAR
jgi:hypothetical protein